MGGRFRLMRWGILLAVVLVTSAGEAWAAPCRIELAPPVPGKAVRPFAPAEEGGHWGVDLSSPRGGVVRAPVTGTVTFSGTVAGMRSVTLAPSSRVRVSLSYLSEVWVAKSQRVRAGQPLGRSGADRGLWAVHLSLRMDGRYLDPSPALDCRSGGGSVGGSLKLVHPLQTVRPPRAG